MLLRILLSGATFAALAAAQKVRVIVEVEASHGGAGNGLRNTTIDIAMNKPYTNQKVLDQVSTLYLEDAKGVPVDTVTCTPFANQDGSGDSGESFDSKTPSYISTNTEQVGSIVCITSYIATAPGSSGLGGLQVASSSTLATRPGASPNPATPSPPNSPTPTPPNPATPSPPNPATPSPPNPQTPSPPATPSPSPAPDSQSSTGNAPSSRYLSGEFFAGLALAGFVVAFAL